MSLRRRLQQSFRPAQTESVQRTLQKTGIQMILFWALFLVVFPMAIMALERPLGIPRFRAPLQLELGWCLFACGGILGVSSSVTMALVGRGTPLPTDCPRLLVVVGAYRFVRNPMAVAGLTQAAAIGLVFGSWGTIGYSLIGGMLWHGWVRPIEEADLAKRFGEPYLRYRSAVRCWIPKFPGYR